MKALYHILFFLHALTGVGAMAGGMAAILNPSSPLGMPATTLKNSPFSNFLIPGIILFTIVGLGNVISAVTIYMKSRFQGYISCTFGGALVIWIVVQCIMIKAVVFLHVLFFIIGLIQAILGAVIIFDKGLFPSNIIKGFYNRIRKQV